jgi:excinuclease ABC subunit B
MDYNEAQGIIPSSIVKEIRALTQGLWGVAESRPDYRVATHIPKEESHRIVKELEIQMKKAAQNLEFEKAALLRDQILEMRRYIRDQDDLPEWERFRQFERRT